MSASRYDANRKIRAHESLALLLRVNHVTVPKPGIYIGQHAVYDWRDNQLWETHEWLR